MTGFETIALDQLSTAIGGQGLAYNVGRSLANVVTEGLIGSDPKTACTQVGARIAQDNGLLNLRDGMRDGVNAVCQAHGVPVDQNGVSPK